MPRARIETTFSFTKAVAQEVDLSERAAQTTIKRLAGNLQRELRRQVKKADLGQGLEKAWQKEVFPTGRQRSMNAAGIVFSKATRLHRAFSEGGTVRAGGSGWLVIPLPAAERRGWDEKPRFGAGRRRGDAAVRAAEATLGKLRFVPFEPGKALLVHGKTAYFLLVKQVRIPRLLDPERAFEKWQRRIPTTLAREFAKQDRRVAGRIGRTKRRG